jgi:hypothetical protein
MRFLLLTAALALPLAACANNEDRPAPPGAVMTLDDRPCQTEIDHATAIPATLMAEKSITLRFDASSPCVQAASGVRSNYAVIRLPETTGPYLLSISSQVRNVHVFSPRLMVLDAQGKVLREKRRGDFVYQGLNLYTGLRAYPGDVFLVVASDGEAVGRQDVQLQGQANQVVISTGVGAAFAINTGAESNRAFMHAYSGIVTVTARPLPPGNEPAATSQAPTK